MKVKNILLLSLGLLCGTALFAQHNEEVTIEGTYRPKVNKVDKVMIQAETPEQSFSMPDTKVGVLEIEHRFPLQLERLSALSYKDKDKQAEAVTKNFLMAGIGTRLSPVFLYKHNSNLTKNLGLGVGIRHFSSWLDIKDYAPSGFMNNAFEIGLSSSKFRDLQLNGGVYYLNDVYHYYGVKTTEWTGDESQWEQMAPRQTYNTIGGRFAMTSTSTKTREFLHNLSADYHYLFSALNSSEHLAEVHYGLSYANNWWGDKSHPQKIGADVNFLFNSFGAQGYDMGMPTLITPQTQTWLELKPYLEMRDEYFRLHLGFLVDGVGSVLEGASRVVIRPDLQGSLFVMNKKVEFYAGLKGGRHPYTYSELVKENPFVGPNPVLGLSNVKLGFDGGIRTNIMNTMDLHLGVRYRHTDHDLFFQQAPAMTITSASPYPYNSFTTLFDETRLVSVLANIRWLPWDRLSVDAGFAYNHCTPTTEEHAWYRPTTEGNLKLGYQFNDALSLNASFLYQGGRWAKPAAALSPAVKLADIYDLGLGADYVVMDDLTVFAKFNNLLNRKFDLYLDYPVTGIEFFAGVKMRF